MAGLKTLLGLYPKTNDYEQKRKELEEEYHALNEFENSEELIRYRELEQFLKSAEFNSTKKELLSIKYNDSEEFRKESEYGQLKKDKALKLYFKTSESDALVNYNKLKDSSELKKFQDLSLLVDSDDFKKVQAHYKKSGKVRFRESDLGQTLASYSKQKNSSKIKGYKKFTGHKLFTDFSALNNSEKLQNFLDLSKLVNSAAFSEKKASMNKVEFQASDEGAKYAEYIQLSKSIDIKNYQKLSKSPNRSFYDELTGSDELEAFLDLEKFVNSEDFKRQRREIEGKTFKDTEEYKKLTEFQQLKNDSQIKSFQKFEKSKNLENYKTIKDSEKLKKYEELKNYLESKDFLDRKKYLTLSPKTRWQQSEAYKQELEFKTLQKAEKIQWYFKNKGHKKFEWFNTWDLTFEDNFDTGQLDRNKWLTRYYWGEEMLQESYSLANEKHCITDGQNLDFNAGILKIATRKEEAEGKIWNPEVGFAPHTFHYTSGLINTGKSFRQKYGLFEAKIKVSGNQNIMNAFWMVGDKTLPHVDVLKAYKKCSLGLQTENGKHQKEIGRSKMSSDFYVVSLKWTAEKMTWMINGLEVKTITSSVPQEEMYLAFSAGLYDEINNGLPSAMEIDWVRCYARK